MANLCCPDLSEDVHHADCAVVWARIAEAINDCQDEHHIGAFNVTDEYMRQFEPQRTVVVMDLNEAYVLGGSLAAAGLALGALLAYVYGKWRS